MLHMVVKLDMLQRPRLLSCLLLLFSGHADAAAQLACDAGDACQGTLLSGLG